ncbi:MAG: UDP-3-O-acyl-N-acetylglucosamine deacetylase [Phycisphaerales bacterium]
MPTALVHRTLARPAQVEGVGLFCPQRCRLVMLPAKAGEGVRFRRMDLAGQPEMAAQASLVVARPRQTVLAVPASAPATGARPSVQTVEHLLSALLGLGISDVCIELHGPEVPLGDGSARPFVEAILSAGIVELPDSAQENLRPIVVSAPIEVAEGDGRITALPAEGSHLDVTYDLDYGRGAPMPPQSAYYRHEYARPDAAAYRRDIAPARTFCTRNEAEDLRAAGLFGHLQPGDVLVLDADGPIGGALRFANEPARHKLLDVLGDLHLAGRPIFGRINAARSGHALNHRMALALASL